MKKSNADNRSAAMKKRKKYGPPQIKIVKLK